MSTQARANSPSQPGVVEGDAGAQLQRRGRRPQPRQRLLERQHARQTAALVLERGAGDLPSAVQFADELVAGNAHLVEEHFAEVDAAGRIAQCVHLDAGRAHVAQQVADAFALGCLRVGAHEHEAPVGDRRQAGPHLLPGDDELVTVNLGPRAQRGEVATRLGLAEALAPQLFGGEDLGQEAPALGLGAVDHQGRPEDGEADGVDQRWCAVAGQLLGDDHLLGEGCLLAAVLLGPREPDVARLPQRALPVAGALQRSHDVAASACCQRVLGAPGVRLQPGAAAATDTPRPRRRSADPSGYLNSGMMRVERSSRWIEGKNIASTPSAS